MAGACATPGKVDDGGTGKGTVAECNENNNTAGLTGVKCYVVR